MLLCLARDDPQQYHFRRSSSTSHFLSRNFFLVLFQRVCSAKRTAPATCCCADWAMAAGGIAVTGEQNTGRTGCKIGPDAVLYIGRDSTSTERGVLTMMRAPSRPRARTDAFR
jgi:hypothetical protein